MSQDMAWEFMEETIPVMGGAVSVGSVLHGSEGCLTGLSGYETLILNVDSRPFVASSCTEGTCPSRTCDHACTGQAT